MPQASAPNKLVFTLFPAGLLCYEEGAARLPRTIQEAIETEVTVQVFWHRGNIAGCV